MTSSKSRHTRIIYAYILSCRPNKTRERERECDKMLKEWRWYTREPGPDAHTHLISLISDYSIRDRWATFSDVIEYSSRLFLSLSLPPSLSLDISVVTVSNEFNIISMRFYYSSIIKKWWTNYNWINWITMKSCTFYQWSKWIYTIYIQCACVYVYILLIICVNIIRIIF